MIGPTTAILIVGGGVMFILGSIFWKLDQILDAIECDDAGVAVDPQASDFHIQDIEDIER